MISLRKTAARLLSDKRAVAMTEFALAAPLVLTAGLWGLETANFALMNMRVNQVAIQISDNASRIGDTSTLSNQKIYENDINDLLRGSDIQTGEAIELYEFGRVFVSSLQVEPGSGGQQYVAWQRCKGRKDTISSYGVQDSGKNDPTFVGMGPPGEEVFAQEGDAVMFIEVQYDYQPIVTDAFIAQRTIRSRAAFQVRANRDLSEIYQRDPASPDEIARCDIYDSYKETASVEREPGGWDWIFSDAPDSGGAGDSGSGDSGGGEDGEIAEEESWFCRTFPLVCGYFASGGASDGGTSGTAGSGTGTSSTAGTSGGSSGSVGGSSGSSGSSSGGSPEDDGGESKKCHTTKKDGYHCHD